jgi:hypothetical protein
MILVIETQIYENYGAHDWNGEGACPQRWKAKGGSSYKVTAVPTGTEFEAVLARVTPELEQDSDYWRESIIGYHFEADDWLSDFERSQLEYEGKITFEADTIDYGSLVDKLPA